MDTTDGLLVVSSDATVVAPPEPDAAPPAEAPAESAPAPTETLPAEDDKPLSGKAFQRYVDRQTRATRDLERRLAEQDGQIDALMRVVRGEPPPQAAPEGPPRRPRQSEFATWDEYEQADNAFIRQAIAYEQQQQNAQQFQQQAVQQQQQLEQERLKAIEGRELEVRKEHPDYDERLQDLLPRITQGVLDALKMSGADGPDLVLHLARNPEDVQRLNATPWHDLGRELGKLIGRRSSPPRQSQPSAPQRLPEPPEPLNGGGATASSTTYREDMSQQQFEDWYARMYPRKRGRLL